MTGLCRFVYEIYAMNQYNAKFKATIRSDCLVALEKRGFTRFRKDNVDWPFNQDFSCWVGLNSVIGRECIELNPFVGIHATSIAKLYSKLSDLRYDRRIATFAIHMGEIVPREQVFDFTHENAQSETERLAELYKGIGLEYAASISSYDALLPLLKSRLKMLGGYPQRYACCLYLMGREQEAVNFINEFKCTSAQNLNYISKFSDAFLKLTPHDKE